jgi:hypothetical protein
MKEGGTVQNAFFRFKRLLKELGLSELDEQKLSIKVEVDANPPKGYHVSTTLINKSYLLNIAHFDLSSLYATKLHACFYRKYTKGRDFYDLIWYIGKGIKPNLTLLNNAIRQTEGYSLKLDEENFKPFLLKKLKGINFSMVKKDVERFLEDKNELRLLEFGIIKGAISKNDEIDKRKN